MSRRVLAPLPRGSPAPEVALLSSAVPSRPGVFQVSRPLLRSAAATAAAVLVGRASSCRGFRCSVQLTA